MSKDATLTVLKVCKTVNWKGWRAEEEDEAGREGGALLTGRSGS